MQALVAGIAGVLPVLSILRIILKAALPQTEAGLRLSIIIYLATSVLVLLIGLGLYTTIVLPAVAAVNLGRMDRQRAAAAAQGSGELPLLPTVDSVSDVFGEGCYTKQQSYVKVRVKSASDGWNDIETTSKPEVVHSNWRHNPSVLNASRLDTLQLRPKSWTAGTLSAEAASADWHAVLFIPPNQQQDNAYVGWQSAYQPTVKPH